MDRRIGAQYYTLRDFTKNIRDFEETCRKVKEIGYKIVQISGTPLGAKEMREVLDRYDLTVVTSHRGWGDFRENLDEIIDYNKTLGCTLCGVGSMPGEYWENNAGVDRFIREVNETAEKLQAAGMQFGYHNHAFEFAKLDGKRIMDRLIGETDPEKVSFIVDTFWLQVGGINPADFIRSLGNRALAVHFKDLSVDPANWTTPAIAEVGEGNLDWDEIIAACDEAGTEWALVEQDTCKGDPFVSMKMSYDYLAGKGFY